ncbi:MAG TPA: hypothetical protein VGE05_10855 [Novosphingobium sp.]
MSFADDEEFASFIGGDHLLPMITARALGQAMDGFALRLRSGIDLGWLAKATRRALVSTLRNTLDGPGRPRNADIREELKELAKVARTASLALWERSAAADAELFRHAFANWDHVSGTHAAVDPDFAYNRIFRAARELEWVSTFLVQAAEAVKSQSPNWRGKAIRDLRTFRGYVLAAIYEEAFGQTITVNNWPTDPRHKAPTPFMDFYKRVMELAFGEPATPNLSQVLKDARRHLRSNPIVLAEWHALGL